METHSISTERRYPTDLTEHQKSQIEAVMGNNMPKLRKYDFFDILCAIFYLCKSGCQWNMLPSQYPPGYAVYHVFRSLGASGWFDKICAALVSLQRTQRQQSASPTVSVIDSRSVRSGLAQSDKGIDGFKKIKGIKQHVVTDKNGYVLGLAVTTANVHDSKGAIPLLAKTLQTWPSVNKIKADRGYSGGLVSALQISRLALLTSVKSNFGTAEFIPIDGRWVIERTFSWFENYRRIQRNYEQRLDTARQIAMACCVAFMLRYFR